MFKQIFVIDPKKDLNQGNSDKNKLFEIAFK